MNRKNILHDLLNKIFIDDISSIILNYDYHLSGLVINSIILPDIKSSNLSKLPGSQFTYIGTSKDPFKPTEEDMKISTQNMYNILNNLPRIFIPFNSTIYISDPESQPSILSRYESIEYFLISFPDGTIICNKSKSYFCELLVFYNNTEFTIVLGDDYSDVIINSNKEEFIFGTLNGYIQVRNFKTQSLKHSIKGHNGTVGSLLIINKYLISASDDNTVKIWDLSHYSNIFIIEDTAMITPKQILNFEENLIISYKTGISVWNYNIGEKIISNTYENEIWHTYILDDQIVLNFEQNMLIIDIKSLNIIRKFDFNVELFLPNKEIISIVDNNLIKHNIINNISEIIYKSKHIIN